MDNKTASEVVVEGRQHIEIQTDTHLEELFYQLSESCSCSSAQTDGDYDDHRSTAFALATLTEDKQTQAEDESITIAQNNEQLPN
jgi:hypothetical protein